MVSTAREANDGGRSGAPGPGPGADRPAWIGDPDGGVRLEGIAPRRRAFDLIVRGALAGLSDWLQRRWLLPVNVALASLVGVAMLVPVLYFFGWQQVGRSIFLAYHLICAQIPSHSYFLFGYQMALCARNLAIFGALFVGSLAFRHVREWLPPLDWRLWALTMLPMALDGGTQMFGWRESTWELRTLTGAIFGLGVCWFALPVIQEAATGAARMPAPSLFARGAVRLRVWPWHRRARA